MAKSKSDKIRPCSLTKSRFLPSFIQIRQDLSYLGSKNPRTEASPLQYKGRFTTLEEGLCFEGRFATLGEGGHAPLGEGASPPLWRGGFAPPWGVASRPPFFARTALKKGTTLLRSVVKKTDTGGPCQCKCNFFWIKV